MANMRKILNHEENMNKTNIRKILNQKKNFKNMAKILKQKENTRKTNVRKILNQKKKITKRCIKRIKIFQIRLKSFVRK